MSGVDALFFPKEMKSPLDIVRKILPQHVEKNKEDSFIVCNLGELAENIRTWKRLLPTVQIFYAVKANDDREILKFLAGTMNVNFDCASKTEIETILGLGVSPSRIVYANTVKRMSYITFAKEKGVDLMTFDNVDELDKIKELHPGASLILRLKPTSDSRVFLNLREKFGCDVSMAGSLLQAAKQRELIVKGISFHVGSCCTEPQAFRRSIKDARFVFDLARDMGYKVDILDIGGGLPNPKEKLQTVLEITTEINSALKDHFSDVSVNVIAEPGMYVVMSSETIATVVIGCRKNEVKAENGPCNNNILYDYYLNDGIFGSVFRHILYNDVNLNIHALEHQESEELYESRLWGPTCTSKDIIRSHCSLPKLRVGDWVCFTNNGAYSLVTSTNFNGMPKPIKYHICNETD